MRIGIGYDIHRLVDGNPFVLGGVTIPSDVGPDAHSDGDALAHAITDALLGAAALGNLGLLYPDTDPAYANADSMALLADAYSRVKAAGYRATNVDSNIILQWPKLNPHVDSIRESVAKCLDLPVEQVSVKPRTNEHVGPEGRGEAVSVQAIVLLEHANEES